MSKKNWATRILALFVAYTVGHWVGWGRGLKEQEEDYG